MSTYFGTDNDFTSKPQNATQTGFNEWDLIKYKPDRDNNGLLSSLSIDNTTEWSYADVVSNVAALSELTASIDVNSVYSDLLYTIAGSTEQVSESIRIEIGDYCKNPVYVAYVNELGGLSYELFSRRQDEEYDINKGDTISSNLEVLESANVREFSIGGSARKILTLYKERIKIAQKDRFNDFKKSIAKRDVLVLNKKFRNEIVYISDYSGTIQGTILVNSPAHGQESDDKITIKDTSNYNGDYDVIKIDEDNFAVIDSFVATETGTMQRRLQKTDWLRCQASDKSDPISNRESIFDIEFEIFLPTNL